jgi:RNA polymerase sigma factor (sigma-70 family)
MTDRERLLGELRPVAFAIAYRMLGSVSEAEDVVQEALLRVHQALDAGEQIASPRAFVATVTTRLAINEMRSARARRERYVGEWLPEPIITDGHDDPARHAETADSLSLAMLVLLESISPEQRAVLLLHDVFDYGYPRSLRSSARARTTCDSSPPAPDATSSSADPASKRRASSATSWHDGSSLPPSKAISLGSRRCSLTTWSSPATAAARFRRSRGRCAGATASRAR